MDVLAQSMTGVLVFMCIFLFWMWFCFSGCVRRRQKTRSTQQRRVYVGARARQASLPEPTIYVSPANLPPPPKYEVMAPPSYEEVMSAQYPSLHSQPITQPLAQALAQSSNDTVAPSTEGPVPVHAVITVTSDDRRAPVNVRS